MIFGARLRKKKWDSVISQQVSRFWNIQGSVDTDKTYCRIYTFHNLPDNSIDCELFLQTEMQKFRIPDDADQNDDYEPAYRDGSLKNECWNDTAWRDN